MAQLAVQEAIPHTQRSWQSGPMRIRLQRLWDDLLNRGLPSHAHITSTVRWPLLLVPIALFNQLFAPHHVWTVLLIALVGLYAAAYFWVRNQAFGVQLRRVRHGTILVAGDRLREEFELANNSLLPVLWAEFRDHSTVPDYFSNRVVACGASAIYRWNMEAVCKQRGLYQLGPHYLALGDPFGLFRLTFRYDQIDTLIIYPRVLQLPTIPRPAGSANSAARQRRPQQGSQPAASVNEYRPGDSLRYIHWRSTAHRGQLMVKEMEIEPSSDVWIILDLQQASHKGEGNKSTLEYAVIAAASLTAEFLGSDARRAVGLLTVAGMVEEVSEVDTATLDEMFVDNQQEDTFDPFPDEEDFVLRQPIAKVSDQALMLAPLVGQAQLWKILAALAPVQASQTSLADLLRGNHGVFGQRRSIIVVTTPHSIPISQNIEDQDTEAQNREEQDVVTEHAVEEANRDKNSASLSQDWVAELLHLQSSGIPCGVMLVTPHRDDGMADMDGINDDEINDRATSQNEFAQDDLVLRSLFAQHNIPVATVQAGEALPAVLSHRRTRTEFRSTPAGGVIAYEVEENVG